MAFGFLKGPLNLIKGGVLGALGIGNKGPSAQDIGKAVGTALAQSTGAASTTAAAAAPAKPAWLIPAAIGGGVLVLVLTVLVIVGSGRRAG